VSCDLQTAIECGDTNAGSGIRLRRATVARVSERIILPTLKGAETLI
jgi:hypothetical protein